jgi:phage terminase large subunit
MNRHVHNDPVYAKFVGRDDCLHIKLNFDDNRFCTQALIHEAAECKKQSEQDYNHIWMGEPLSQSEDQVFSHTDLQSCKKTYHAKNPNYSTVLMGFDIARYGDDKCAAIAITQTGALHWSVTHVEQWDNKDLNYTTGRILMTASNLNATKSTIDEDGMGAGPLDTLNKGRGLDQFVGFRNPAIGYKENKFYGNNRTKNTYKVRDMIQAGQLHIEDDELLAELETMRYTFDHQQRRILISKDKMRKDGIKSPNLADALIMAVSLVDEVKENQDRKYVSRATSAVPDENLFGLAGIR